jgi:hypothetical protein
VVLIFDLSFGKRGLIVHAPVDGAQALVDESVLVEGEEGREHDRLVLGVHGGVRLVEAAEDADPLELLTLQVEKLLGVLATFCAHVGWTHLQLLAAEFLIHLDLDGQAVAIPAGDVGRVKSRHGFRFDDEILEAFVQRRAQVDGPAGIGRAIVQNIAGCAFAGLADTLVDSHLLPSSQYFGLVLRQVGLHGEGGLRQIDGGFQFKRHPVCFSQLNEFFIIGRGAGNV